MKGNVNKFEFKNLPKISAGQMRLNNTLGKWRLDVKEIEIVLNEALKGLEPFSFQKLALEFRTCMLAPKARALGGIGKKTLSVMGVVSPKNIPFLIEIEEQTAIDLVYILLGRQTEAPLGRIELTPVEEGIFTFILGMAYEALHKHFSFLIDSSIQLGPLVKATPEIETFKSETDLVNFSFSLRVENTLSTLHLYVAANPYALVIGSAEVEESPFEVIQHGLARASHFSAPISAIIGETRLAPEQLGSLQVDDIIVLDGSALKLLGDTLSGTVACDLGEPLFANAMADLSVSSKGNYSIQILDLQLAQKDFQLS